MPMKDNTKSSTLSLTTKALFVALFGKKKLGSYHYSCRRIPSAEWNIQTAGRINSLKIEVRSSEKPHNLPHFHVTAPGKIDAVYTIDPVALYEGEIDGKSNKKILEWAELNRSKLVEMWNDYHGYRIKVS